MIKTIELEGFQLAVKPIQIEQTIDDNTVLLFLHEALGSIGQWKGFPEQLCKALKLNGIVYERQGYGGSSPLSQIRNERYLHEYAWTELPQLLSSILPIEKKVILVGHSDGGSIALLFAAKYPQWVRGVVSMAAHVVVEEITLEGIAPAVVAYEAGKLEGLKKYHGEKTEELFYAWANTWNAPHFKDWNLCNDIQSVQCPVLAFQGVKDQYGSARQLELIAESCKEAQVTTSLLANCGHHPHLEAAVPSEKLIIAWCEENFKDIF